ncbi:cupin domain-containing protein [Kocuria sp.]|uniref:cupin domain-containing protein n=1 Tax=Kocuria sp. TaxID=1871328 RepID=UPI0026DC9560|nr:cupin domain-containing protein [Kocuria sp.]MDO4918793.1 cupin domain-containing protein [Kocuria sp.]
MTHTAPARSQKGPSGHGEGAEPTGGTATLAETVGRSEPRHGHPSATTVLDEDGVRIVAFEFGAGDALKEHATPHPALVQVVRGRVNFTLPDGVLELGPGRVLHLTEGLRHAVDAVETTTLTVTLLPSASSSTTPTTCAP